MSIEIRPATGADLPHVLRLLGEMYPEDPVLSAPRSARIWAEIEAQSGRSLLVAQDAAGHLVGTVDCVVMPNLSRGGRPRLVMENLVVSESHRRRGVGRLLMDEVRRTAGREGCYKIQFLAAEDDYVHAFYRSCGFSRWEGDGFYRYL
ncbi:GNAT family N-acetyltransferase [Nocardiopsis metallicus]|uniref:Ribosomal protein S18 acetylase RimI-like enzyme n=1 Tax=Nocardiopsis metallicus TaxID=179819 RepID=A0A840VXK7_9ACTN|nr:GNAT family N-acetyltransferase [Nocardiopsis metallicus]MBB5489099.1 ribosomal protein S18 acetylase RimI-like enzyme [Nocardiopsis metallicus]